MGLHIISNNLNIDFIGFRRISYIVSIALIFLGIGFLVLQGGPRYGIDFAGGATAHVRFAEPIADEELKKALEGANLPGLVVQSFGDDQKNYLLRISAMEEGATGISGVVENALNERLRGRAYETVRIEMVGPKVGADLRARAIEAVYFSILIIAVYISGRFEQRWFIAALMAALLGGAMLGLGMMGVNKLYLTPLAVILTMLFCWRFKLVFALGAIISILHDVLITVGLFAMMGKEFDLTIIAALLTIVGYSLNDTIIVYDRIRENLRGNFETPLPKILNNSINQTLSRTILTSGTTLMVISSLLIFGGGMIHDFALVMFIGVLVGTASSIFVATPVFLYFDKDISREDPTARQDKRARDADGRLAAQV